MRGGTVSGPEQQERGVFGDTRPAPPPPKLPRSRALSSCTAPTWQAPREDLSPTGWVDRADSCSSASQQLSPPRMAHESRAPLRDKGGRGGWLGPVPFRDASAELPSTDRKSVV